ncbi:MAG: hypothetical protein BGP13_17440 [Sphingobacteriales bacterium 40-81]|nr:MAG: hypothetical protein BGP13_17440 [Sphingobacteriales bacterium 40-81]
MENQLELVEKIYKQTQEWYKSAETKAQIMLTMLSSFIAFSTAIILANPENIAKTLSRFNVYMFLLLAFGGVGMLLGIYNAFMCIKSRVGKLEPKINKQTGLYFEEDIYFFGDNANHEADVLTRTILRLTDEKIIKMYAAQTIIVSQNVKQKHKYVNRSFASVLATIFLFVCLITLYLLKVKVASP